ncbi:MAG: polysaccharide deacetylase family protein [Gemmatimonadota bacterium]|nr:polysaccharide deacetylase family protein [Gemmatimonadota bacterium]
MPAQAQSNVAGQPATAHATKRGTGALRRSAATSDNGEHSAPAAARAVTSPDAGQLRKPNELGRIPITEWHQVVDADGTYKVSRERFLAELTELHARGYVPISLGDYLDKKIDIPAGKSPVLFTFDDASPSQFSYIERNGQLTIDPRSAIGILMEFIKQHPDWKPRGVFCMLPAAAVGHAFFGEKGIDGQKTAWRFQKVQYLAQQGFDLCNHTLWHAMLNKYSDAVVQEQLARGAMAIDSAVPGYHIRGFALPYGLWPKNKALAYSGSWYDKKGKREVKYANEAVFEVAGGPARSPFDPAFNAHSLPRVQLQGGTKLTPTLDALDKPGPMSRYVSDGNPKTIARPE